MTTYSNLKYDHAFSSNATGTGALTLLSTQTASNSTSLSFTTGIDSTYKEYMFKFINMHPATDGVDFTFNGSTDGGSNYNVTKTTTIFFGYHAEDGSASALSYVAGYDLAQSTSDQLIMENLGNSNDESGSGTLHLFEPSSDTFVKHFMVNTNSYASYNYSQNYYTAGYFNSTSAIDAVDFKFSSGNIDSGVIKLYGIS